MRGEKRIFTSVTQGSMVWMALCSFLAVGVVFADKPIFVEDYDSSIPHPPREPCDGLALNGVHYAFTVGGAPSADCIYGGTSGPGTANNIYLLFIEGNASGVLHLAFDSPTTRFGFGVAQSMYAPPQQVIINLNRPGVGMLRETLFLTTTPDPFYVGGRYDYDGPAVKTVTIAFSNVGGRFAIDNTTYFRPPGQAKK